MRAGEDASGIVVRSESSQDHDDITRVVARAFASPGHARLVEAIRCSKHYVADWALVAVRGEALVGHVMVSYVTLRTETGARSVPSLSPLAVEPGEQRRGVGSALVRSVCARVDNADEPLIVLEGSPIYYARFGFEFAGSHGITMDVPTWAPREAAQVLRLRNYDPSIRGHVVYPPAFALVGE